ncbi:hypothetical protein [Hymenobacter psoromatis]|uniref:hypothetical protein n=1 Tax=Hymenobacter psoromatis TaxID=1484116 RepID=UPI001CBAFEA3|nr:hypothetical protein [Hymenobacter psoromatis]
MAGRTRLVSAEANLKPNRYGNGRDWLTVRVGERHLAVGEGTFTLDYVKPSRAPESAYQLQLLTYTYRLNDSVSYNINCAHHLTGTLHKLRNGGYSGTFAGTSQAKEGEEYPVQGDFTNVFSQ